MINNIVLTGRLTKEIDLRYTSNGTAVGSFNLAVERNFKNAQGERETDFISCVIWRKSAESLASFTRKGSLIGIEGSIQTRNYENQQGQRVYVTEINVENFTLLEPKAVTEQRPRETTQNNNQTNNYQQNNNQNQNGGWVPQTNQQQTQPHNDPFLSGGQSININDDDLPF